MAQLQRGLLLEWERAAYVDIMSGEKSTHSDSLIRWSTGGFYLNTSKRFAAMPSHEVEDTQG